MLPDVSGGDALFLLDRFATPVLFQRPEQFVEVRGDRFVQGEEPDLGLVLLAVLAVERLEDFLRRFGRAEHLVEQGDRRLIQGERGQIRSGPEAASRLLQGRARIPLRQRREWLVVFQIREQLLGLFLLRRGGFVERCRRFLKVAIIAPRDEPCGTDSRPTLGFDRRFDGWLKRSAG